MMIKWEYKTMEFKTHGFNGGKIESQEIQDALNHLGSEGWELVLTTSLNTGNGSSRAVLVMMKRPLSQ